jgi:NCAIR mutase (PurE)-related protein
MSDTEKRRLEVLLADVAAGKLPVNQALDQLLAENQSPETQAVDLGYARLDIDRARRTGVAEVIFAAGKTTDQLLGLIEAALTHVGKVLATRVKPEQADAAVARFPQLVAEPIGRLLHTPWPEPHLPLTAVLSAGTSDQPVADEAAGVLRYLGHHVHRGYDVGVAGIHRLFRELSQLTRKPAAFIAVAGMEGALPSVLAGLVDRPVIAVPTSIGYGASFSGLAALLAMLNSCASGVGVVNIDNGFGAAMFAHRIARDLDAGENGENGENGEAST